MSFFSRLSDIISYNLQDIILNTPNPGETLHKVIAEIEEGLAGARRSVAAATNSELRLQTELTGHRDQILRWTDKARAELTTGHEDLARLAILRKKEVEDLVAGLEQQYAAAIATREQLTTTLRAIEARLAEAQRQVQLFESGHAVPASAVPLEAAVSQQAARLDPTRADQIEAELEALRRELET
jgi:phage shock protein A